MSGPTGDSGGPANGARPLTNLGFQMAMKEDGLRR